MILDKNKKGLSLGRKQALIYYQLGMKKRKASDVMMK
jgi:hypothetical protein